MRKILLALLLLAACASDALAGSRRIQIANGRPLTPTDEQTLARVEQAYGRRVPDGRYWYDNATGATGMWGGPTVGFLQAGLGLGGALPAGASGGGNGKLTGVFINGRELHPVDVQGLRQLLGQVLPGRYWVDAQGNAGYEGGPALVNLLAVARQRQAQSGGGGGRYTKGSISGDGTFVSQGCTAVNGHLGASSSSASYSYFIGCE